jgi:hypothetical protein
MDIQLRCRVVPDQICSSMVVHSKPCQSCKGSCGGSPVNAADGSQVGALSRCTPFGEVPARTTATRSLTWATDRVAATCSKAGHAPSSQRLASDLNGRALHASGEETHEIQCMDSSHGGHSCTCGQNQPGSLFKVEWYESNEVPNTSSTEVLSRSAGRRLQGIWARIVGTRSHVSAAGLFARRAFVTAAAVLAAALCAKNMLDTLPGTVEPILCMEAFV